MSINIFEIHLQTDKESDVIKVLAYRLSKIYRENPEIITDQPEDIDFFQKEEPTCFAVASLFENWVTIRHNSFEKQVSLANELSQVFNVTAIQAMGQSTVDTYHLSVHQDGKIVRSFNCGEDTNGLECEGTPLPFEAPIDDPENYFYDYEDMHAFCKNFGIELVTDANEHKEIWTLIRIKEKSVQEKPSFLASVKALFGGAAKH